MSVLILLHGLAFFFGAEYMARMGVPDISATALMMAKGVHEIVAFFSVFLAIVFFFCRDLDVSSAKKVLTGAAIGLLVTLVGIA